MYHDHSLTNDMRKQFQTQNFANGTGLLLNIHITHHAGTSFCTVFHKLGSPPFACMGLGSGKEKYSSQSRMLSSQDVERWHDKIGFQRQRRPWLHNETSQNIETARNEPYNFRVMSWELGRRPKTNGLDVTNWEDPNLVSVIVMRDPMSRLMSRPCQTLCKRFRRASSSTTPPKSPARECEGFTREEWWWYANSRYTDNYALQKLTAHPDQVNGNQTTRRALESAQALVRRFTYVLDIACLDDSLEALAKKLDVNVSEELTAMARTRRLRKERRSAIGGHNKSKLKTILFPDIVEYVRARNARDIELYQWSKQLSLVKCAN